MKYLAIIYLMVFVVCAGKSPEYYYQQGNWHLDKKEYEKAIPLYTKAIKENSEYSEAYFKRGYCKLQIDSNVSAIKDFDKVIALKPDGDVYNLRAKAKYELKDSVGSCEDWNMGCELMSTRACELYRIKCR